MIFEHGILEKRQQQMLKASSKGSKITWNDVEGDSLEVLNAKLDTIIHWVKLESPTKFHCATTLCEREFVNEPTSLTEGRDFRRRGTKYARN